MFVHLIPTDKQHEMMHPESFSAENYKMFESSWPHLCSEIKMPKEMRKMTMN